MATVKNLRFNDYKLSLTIQQATQLKQYSDSVGKTKTHVLNVIFNAVLTDLNVYTHSMGMQTPVPKQLRTRFPSEVT